MDIFSLSIAATLSVLLQICITVHILLYKEDVKSSIGWIGLVWLSPLFGALIYAILGINRIKRKALALKNPKSNIKQITGKTIEELEQQIPLNFRQLLKLGYKIHPQLFVPANNIVPLINGDEAYPQMADAIKKAKKQVLIESYIFNNDTAGQTILDACAQAVKNGIQVRIIVDGVGLNYSRPDIKKAAEKIKELQMRIFLPSKKPAAMPFVNLRNHRKIMIIDGQTAFFGGMNIAQENLLKTNPATPVKDTTFKIEGPVIDQLARIFLEDWIFTGGQNFKPEEFKTDKKEPCAEGFCRAIPDGPDSDYGKVKSIFFAAINSATKNIKITTPYFLPDDNILTALEFAAMRGIDTEIILPQKSNIFGMDYAMRANFARLIKSGVKIYLQEPPFDHSKLLCIDGIWSVIGSANWDERSLKLNFESLLEIMDLKTTKQIEKIINAKKALSTKQQMPAYPFYKKILCNAFKLLTPYY